MSSPVAAIFPRATWRQITAAAVVLVLAIVAAYHNSFSGPFVYDDLASIVENPTIRRLWPIGQVFSPPSDGETVAGRPVLNLSLAIDYAWAGVDVRTYHVTNLLIHIAAALVLFGILRRTFTLPDLCERFGRAATPLAAASALIWAIHPLQTESVTYVVQRAESLMGLFYLLTLYGAIRGASPTWSAGLRPAQANAGETPALRDQGEKGDGPPGGTDSSAIGVPQAQEVSRNPLAAGAAQIAKLSEPPLPLIPRLWYAAAVLACLLGMACKEVMVTAPLMVLLYDRTFLAGSLGEAWRRRWPLYVGLAATWALLAYLVLSTGLILRQQELGSPDAWSYARSQPGVILHYLRLSVFPAPLCFDYAWPVADTFGVVFPAAIVVGTLAAATIWGLARRKAWGFLGAWFLLILTPTSSVLPLRQLAHEHRMYLPLAAVVVLAVAGGYSLGQRVLPRRGLSPFSPPRTQLCQSPQRAKKGTVPLAPTADSGRGAEFLRWAGPLAALLAVLVTLGCATAARNSAYRSLLTFWQDAVDKCPASAVAHSNLGVILGSLRRTEEATRHCQQALRLKPDYAEAHNNLGLLLASVGRIEEAIQCYDRALALRPRHASTHNNLGLALAASGKTSAAIEHYRQALRLKPEIIAARHNLASLLLSRGATAEAIEHYQEILRLKPDDAVAHNHLAIGLVATGRTAEAIEQYRQALHVAPEYIEAHNNLGRALADTGKVDEAIEHYRQAIRLKPDFTVAVNNLAWLLATSAAAQGEDPAAAIRLAERARELGGQESAQCLDTLAAAYAATGRFADAMLAAERAVQLAESTGQAPLARAIRSRLELYRAGQPYRELPGSPEAAHR